MYKSIVGLISVTVFGVIFFTVACTPGGNGQSSLSSGTGDNGYAWVPGSVPGITPSPSAGVSPTPETPGATPSPVPGVVTPTPAPAPAPVPVIPVLKLHDVTAGMPKGPAASLAVICATPGADRFRAAFCGNNPPNITSLTQLFTALGLNNTANSACTTNSASLVKSESGVLNPRCIRFSNNGQDNSATAVGFMRAKLTFAEVAARDPNTGLYKFYLVDFDMPCELTNTCTNADYYLPSSESNWARVSFYEDTQLKNTVLDCTMCHQPGGPAAPKTLRMAETDNPWMHWFRNNRPCGQTLFADFNAAHANDGVYAGLTIAQVNNSDPARLETFVEGNGFQGANFGNNFVNSNNILNETGQTAGQPQSNATPGVSATWLAQFNARSAATNLINFGGVLMPYHDCKQSDPATLATMTQQYRQVQAGQLPAAQMPDLALVNKSTETDLRARTMMPRLVNNAIMDGPGILANACVSCHNSNLDQTISRANFNAQDLTKNTASIYDRAIVRINREDPEDARRMPPHTFMSLSSAEITTLTNYFNQLKAALPAQ